MKDGRSFGVIIRENAANVFLRTAESPERPVPVPKAQIANRGGVGRVADARGSLYGYSQAEIFKPPEVHAGAAAGEMMRGGTS